MIKNNDNAIIDGLKKISIDDLELLKSVMLERLFYISHPEISSLECSINLNNTSVDPDELFNNIIAEITSIDSFNRKEISINLKVFTLSFVGESALKLLRLLLDENPDHALYPLYSGWLLKGF